MTEAHKKKEAAYHKLYTAQEKYSKSTDLTVEESNSLKIEIGNLSDEYDALIEEYLTLQEVVEPYRKEQEKLQEEIDEATAVMQSYEGEIRNAENAMELFNKKTAESGDDQSELATKIQSVQGEIDELSAAYADAQNAARESIDSQIGLFDELGTESDWSAEKVISNWKAQKKAFTDYQSNLKKAEKLGLDKAIVEQLSDGSEESMQILAALVNDSKIRVADINKAFEGLDQSKENVSRTIADIQTDFTDTLDDIADDARRSGITIGGNLVAGIAEGFIASAAIPDVAFDRVVDSMLNGRTPTFDFEKNLSGFSSYYTNLKSQLARAESYPDLYSGSVATQNTTNSRTLNMGGVTVQIYAQPGQDI